MRAALASERDAGRLREEFIAVMGHDLRNPLVAVGAKLAMLSRRPDEAKSALLIAEMQRSVARMDGISRADFARGRLGAGMEVLAPRPADLTPVLRSVVQEVARVAEQPIETTIDPPRPIRADPQRLGQLLSNLLGNAATRKERRSGSRQGTGTACYAPP